MNAFAAVVLARQIASIWAPAMFAAWLFLYTPTKVSDHPDAGQRPA